MQFSIYQTFAGENKKSEECDGDLRGKDNPMALKETQNGVSGKEYWERNARLVMVKRIKTQTTKMIAMENKNEPNEKRYLRFK